MVNVIDINALPVLVEWAVKNGHDAPVFYASTNSVSIAGVNDADIKSVLDAATAASIASAQGRSIITSFQAAYPKPKNATLEQYKSWAMMIAKKVVEHLRILSTQNASYVTLSGWTDKLSLSEKIAASTATPAEVAILQAEADMRGLGETAAQLAAKVILKGNALRTIRSTIDGFDSKVNRNIKAVTDLPSYHAAVDALLTEGAAIINTLGV